MILSTGVLSNVLDPIGLSFYFCKHMAGIKMMGLKNTELVLSIKKKKVAFYGHIRRHHSLQKLVLEGKVDGKRGRGRRRKSWSGNVSEMAKRSMA